MTILPAILAGGSGTRLWPVSRAGHPKQLLPLTSERSLLQETATRLRGFSSHPVEDRLVVVTNAEYRFTVAEQLRALGVDKPRIVLEPVGRNTAPALTLAALLTSATNQPTDEDPDPLLLVMPADHTIRNLRAFREALSEGTDLAAAGAIVTFGILPHRAETGYGYIKAGDSTGRTARVLAGFTEKPSEKTALEYLNSRQYFWNSGMFIMQRSLWLRAIDRFAPEIVAVCREACSTARRNGDFIWVDRDSFLACPSDSIDRALMERLPTAPEVAPAYVVPLAAGWSDIGAWDAVWAVSEKDPQGNAARGETVLEDCTNTLVYADDRLVVAAGCNELVIAETADAVLVSPLEKARQIKDVVARLADQRPDITQRHRRVYRPWGRYESIDAGKGFHVKRIVVDPGASLSLQYHRHRAEHWVVVKGSAEVTRGKDVFTLTENQSTYVPVGVTHRLRNLGDHSLEIIEVQTGTILDEDDIVRTEDEYGRSQI